MSHHTRLALLVASVLTAVSVAPAAAEKIANKVAVFSGLDKITGRIITFDVYIGETVQFGMLQVTPRVCYSRPETEAAATDAFVQVDEVTLDSHIREIFNGWMFASSPGLNAVEHPVYDVWLSDCRMESDIPPPSGDGKTRLAAARSSSGGGSDRASGAGEIGLTLVGGIPVPPLKPAMPTMIDTTDPNAPTEDNGQGSTDSQVLD